MANPKLLVFGSQAQTWTEETMANLRTVILSSPWRFQWMLDVLAELPALWEDGAENLPTLSLQLPHASSQLEALRKYFTSGQRPSLDFPLTNILLTPLVVLTHLTQFTMFFDSEDAEAVDDGIKAFPDASATVGLCTGFLSALAVSASRTRGSLSHWGPVAVRLAMLIGAAVDADDTEADAQSFTASWGPKETIDTLHRIVEEDGRRYVSVYFDERRATVTTSKSDAPELTRQLKSAGLGVGDVRLNGNFHCARHQKIIDLLIEYSANRPDLQFPPIDGLTVPTVLELGSVNPVQEKLHVIALRAILLHPAQWYSSFIQAESNYLQYNGHSVVVFGPERCVPRSILSRIGTRVIQVSDLDLGILDTVSTARMTPYLSKRHVPMTDSRIAVIGMACRVPGAADLDQFSDLLRQGRSQHTEVPRHRFEMDTVWRPLDSKRQWYGNFLDDYDSFDNRFFKKSAREAASMDPQHRLILQAAYQALEQSGYFHNDASDKHIGCFLGVGLVDYENNIACHPATAYTATGILKSFAGGRISHHFGWTGPSLTLDTACSSSAVAVHQACRAILHGECPIALAGAVNLMTSPDWFHNLAGASFLSPTGQCKPFDSKADGYCRGEAVGALVLKNYAAALADGDQILGIIAATEVFQNENCTPITVPNSVSLSSLFRTVVEQAQLEPSRVTVVEAHGTGTPVGDPAEYESIKEVFACPGRLHPVSLGSVKGLVGHGEPASGLTALIKILIMAREGFIPPQPSFATINPSINGSNQIEISQELRPWTAEPRVALINNYGASGSNASLVVMQAPTHEVPDKSPGGGMESVAGSRFPFWLSGLDQASICRYASRLREFVAKQDDNLQLSTMSFHMSRQTNHSLDYTAIMCCNSINDLDAKLASIEQGAETPALLPTKAPRPIILCFGGQISTFVGLDRTVYDTVDILRRHLDACNSAAIRLGLPSIYPGIFQRSALNSIVQLQVMLFSIQYSCAESWIDCGLSVAAVVGHSFGELTGLCVSGGLDLEDALTMISVRAQLIEEYWGSDKGAMIAVEGDMAIVQQILDTANEGAVDNFASIACFNASRSFTLAGPVWAIDRVEEVIRQPVYASSVRGKRLNVTNSFHSSLVEPLVPRLTELGRKLHFRKPTIPWERAMETDTNSSFSLSEKYVAEHMRNPVYFASAVQRLAQRHPSAIWLEAGSNSTITSLASRALGSEVQRNSHFQSINITTDRSFQSLADATSTLWKEGVRVDFWPHHASQARSYPSLLLPPYQFDNCPHWMQLKRPEIAALPSPGQHPSHKPSVKLWSLVQRTTHAPQTARFQIHTDSIEYQDLVSGHLVVQTNSICPSIFQVEFTVDALISLEPKFQQGHFRPQLHGMQSYGPLGLTQAGTVWLDVKALDQSGLSWEFSINSESQPGAKLTRHATGRFDFLPSNDERTQAEFARYTRLIPPSRCQALLNSLDIDEAMQGRSIYKNFAEIVNYSSAFKGLQKIVSSGLNSAGRVIRPTSTVTKYVETGLIDSFCQVAGIFINCMTEIPESDMFISDRIERWMRSPCLHTQNSHWPDAFDVFATSQRVSEKEMLSDIFVFDPASGEIVEVILGVHYQRLPKNVMRQIVAKINGASLKPSSNSSISMSTASDTHPAAAALATNEHGYTPASAENPSLADTKGSDETEIFGKVRTLLCELSGLDPEDIKVDSGLGDIGIDSLMGMEVAREIENTFSCSLDISELESLTDVASLIHCVRGALGQSDANQSDQGGTATGSDAIPDSNEVYNIKEYESVSPVLNGLQAQDVPHNGTIAEYVQAVMKAFSTIKKTTDDYLVQHGLAGYSSSILPRSSELCIVHILDAFDALGCSIRNAKPGETVPRISYLPRHEQLVDFIYSFLEQFSLLEVDGSRITRTATACPRKSASQLMDELLADGTDHSYDHQLTYLVGTRLADCLSGKADGLQLIFGSPEGREAATGMYSRSPINLPWIKQMEAFLRDYVSRLGNMVGGSIHILEMGAGTGGTTAVMAPMLDALGVPIVYTVTDLSSSLVAGLRKRFKQYSFLTFKTCNIEDQPPTDLLQSQHIVLATNCVHATHNLSRSASNVRQMLRSDGVLMMLEMTEPLPWVDLVFGLLEGWWLFDDGRLHALAPPEVWESTLHSAGYGFVDWTDGHRPEASIQRLIMAMASGTRYDNPSPLPSSFSSPSSGFLTPPSPRADILTRQATIDAYVEEYTRDFDLPSPMLDQCSSETGVLVTGATGSLGSHLVADLARLPEVQTVVCLNRPRGPDGRSRQLAAFQTRGIDLDETSLGKIHVFQADTTKPGLGLSKEQQDFLLRNISHIVHNAWPMSISRPIDAFRPQFQVLRNLLDLAAQISAARPTSQRVGFQFISSIATVGLYSRRTGKTLVPEIRTTAEMALHTGYSEAKLVCEHMVDETLHQFTSRLRPMVVRIGQIAGSSNAGYWNPVEHFAFMLKSSQTLRTLPQLGATLSWCPVDTVAATLSELLLHPNAPASPIYHIENPVRQPWSAMLQILADALDAPAIVPFDDWIRRVRQFPGSVEENPAARLVDFLDEQFVAVSCGGLVLDTACSQRESPILAECQAVSEDLVRLYVQRWEEIGFLRPSASGFH